MVSSHTPATPATDFRSWLGKRSDDELARILTHRPDATHPLPPGIAPLATRLLLRTSLARALATCTAAELAALERLVAAGAEFEPVEFEPSGTAAVIDALKDKALVFDTDDSRVMVPREVMAALPADWSLLEQHAVDPADIEKIDKEQRRVLETLAPTGLGTTRDAAPDADPARPIPRLIAAGLLQRVDARTVRLPRATRLALRGQAPLNIPLEPSGRQGQPVQDQKTDEAGAAAGLDVVRLIGRLIDILGQEPVELLKDKTVGVRPLAHLAKELDTDYVKELIALGFHARLLGRGEPKGGPEGNFLAPTQAAQEWADAPLPDRLQVLLDAWETSPWAAWESQRGLDQETAHDYLPRHRARILDVYKNSSQPLNLEEFWEDLCFARPLFAAHTQPATIEHLHAEAQWLGVIARGALVQERPVPEAVEHFIMQADMTVLTPGPLVTELLRTLENLADLESPGLASVYRISTESLRRGMDSGMTAQEIKDFLHAHALGEVPQAVEFLIDDVGRRHGTLRSGTALAYVRCEDEALLAQAVAAVDSLRLLAPTVAISQQRLGLVLEELRSNGFAPAAEDEHGASIAVHPEPALLPTPRAHAPRREEPDVARAVAAIRTAEPTTTPEGPDIGLIEAAARGSRLIVVGYADRNGRPREVTVTPLTVAGGQVDALDRDGHPVRFPLHRIMSARLKD